MNATTSPRTVTIDGNRIRIADVARYRAQIAADAQPGEDAPTDAHVVWSYTLGLLARRACGRRGVLVNITRGSYASDGSYSQYEATFGTPANDRRNPEARWVSCVSEWVTYRDSEIAEAVAALNAS